MKKFCYIAGIALAIGGTLWAQTNTTTNTTATVSANTNALSQILALVTTNPPPPKLKARQEIVIESDSVDFDLTTREATYRGHVRVDDPEMKLSCERLIADLPQGGGRITNLVAVTNVVIDFTDNGGQTNHATCDKAVYAYRVQNSVTNETVTLTGNAKVENAKGWLTGEPIVWNRGSGSLTASNEHMVFWQNLNGTMAVTNSSAMETNSPFVKTNLLPAVTNQMSTPK